MNWKAALELGRVSNLPTVWTNTIAGVALAGASPADARVPWLLLALSLCYVAGMFLNDAFDREFDARHRSERPIPSGRASAAAVFGAGFGMLATGVLLLAWTGFGMDGGTGAQPLLAGLALGAAIVAYDLHHKQNAWSPVIMGLCRTLVYVAAACAVAAEPPGRVFGVGLLLLSYLMGLTYIARQEHLGRIASLWPLLFLVLPLFWAAPAAADSALVAMLWLLLLGWIVYALSFLRRRGPGDVPRAVGALLAGICLWDALVVAVVGQPQLVLPLLGCFALTLVLQRFVAPT
jgi:4-hydroxybenzoate polyprenyltransferase